MSRHWTEFVAAIGDAVPLPLALLVLVLATSLVAILWYTYPAWIPRSGAGSRFRLRWPGWTWKPRWPKWRRPRLLRLRLPRLRFGFFRLRWPWRRKPRKAEEKTIEEQIAEVLAAEEELPSVPVTIYQSLADRLAAQGRYAEALRERYRAAVRDLVQHGIIDNRPGWTVTELARAAVAARPAVDAPLTSATGLFSEVWYAERPATAEHDERMRTFAGDVHENLGSGR